MVIDNKQLRRELLMCMVEQDWMNFKIYKEEMKKIDKAYGKFYGGILKNAIHKIMNDKLNTILRSNE